MNHLTRSKLVLALTVIFAAGAVAGTIVTWGRAKRNLLQPTSMEKVCSYMEDRMKARLDLTPTQCEKIRPILDQTAREMKSIHVRSLQEIDQAIQKSNEQIARELTTEQKRKLDEMEAERREFLQKRMKGPGSTGE